MKEIELLIRGEKIILTNDRALYWPDTHTLILSDLHLGKSAHFRKHGIAVPQAVNQKDLQRLNRLFSRYETRRILVVGDLIHAGINSDLGYFKEWMDPAHQWILVKGNHDRMSNDLFQSIGVSVVVNEWKEGPFLFTHEMEMDPNYFCIAGHLHPGKEVQIGLKRSMSFPTFVINDEVLILPAYSEFTGLDCKEHLKRASYYVLVKDELLKF